VLTSRTPHAAEGIPPPVDITGLWAVTSFSQRPGAPYACFRDDGALEFAADGGWIGHQQDQHTYTGTYRFLSATRIRLVSGITYLYDIDVHGDDMALSDATTQITLHRASAASPPSDGKGLW
jgi:hypothetical protein